MENLWKFVVKRKYIDPMPIDDWMRRPNNKSPHMSVVWKATLDSFKIVEEGLTWHVGSGDKIRIVIDPWVGCNKAYPLSRELQNRLHGQGCLFLNEIVKQGLSTTWKQGWKIAEDLMLVPPWTEEWQDFLK